MMTHAAQLRHARLGTAIVLLGLLAGCGGESSVSVGVPTDNHGPLIVGQVQLPNGKLAAAPSLVQRLASLAVARVEALVNGTVQPVGAGVAVHLSRIGNSNIVNGQIHNATLIASTNTAADGGFGMHLPTDTTPDTCRFIIEVGSGSTLTRAFVDDDQVTVDYQSEATVRLVLEQIQAGKVSLCDLTSADLRAIQGAVQSSNHEAFGDSVSAVNNAAVIAAASDPAVQSAIDNAVAQPTPVGTNTPPQPTGTATVAQPTATAPSKTPTLPPTRTSTSVPTRTSTTVPTRTATPAGTNTVPPTRTNTAAPTNTGVSHTPTATATATGVATGTAAATATFTATALPTGTAQATATFTATIPTVPTTVSTPTFTKTSAPTFTATPVPPATATATSAGGTPSIDIGVVAGTAGLAVDVPVVLAARGASIAATSNDIEFDAAALSVVLVAGNPDCTIDARLAGVKETVAKVADVGGGRQRLRVGVVGLNNNTAISSGGLFSCRFTVAANAPDSIALENTPDAAGPGAQAVAVGGSDGRIDVGSAPPTLALEAGTAAVGATVDVTATLSASDVALAALGTDIRFDADRLSAVLAGSAPDCSVDAAVAALGKSVVTSVLPADEDGLAGVRVGVLSRTNNAALPAGALFSCRFRVLTGGGSIALEHSPEGATPAAQPVDVFGQAGTISVP